MPILFLIENEPVSLSSVMKRAMKMNFGFPIAEREPLPWRIEIPLPEFLRIMEAEYTRLLAELQTDERYDDGTHAVVNGLRAANWPSLPELAARDPKLLGETIRCVLFGEVLDALTTGAPHATYQLNTLESVRVTDAKVALSGMCYRT